MPPKRQMPHVTFAEWPFDVNNAHEFLETLHRFISLELMRLDATSDARPTLAALILIIQECRYPGQPIGPGGERERSRYWMNRFQELKQDLENVNDSAESEIAEEE